MRFLRRFALDVLLATLMTLAVLPGPAARAATATTPESVALAPLTELLKSANARIKALESLRTEITALKAQDVAAATRMGRMESAALPVSQRLSALETQVKNDLRETRLLTGQLMTEMVRVSGQNAQTDRDLGVLRSQTTTDDARLEERAARLESRLLVLEESRPPGVDVPMDEADVRALITTQLAKLCDGILAEVECPPPLPPIRQPEAGAAEALAEPAPAEKPPD